MKAEFDLTAEDIERFARYVTTESPGARKWLLGSRMALALLFAALAVATVVTYPDRPDPILYVVVVSVAYLPAAWLLPWGFARMMARASAQRQIADGNLGGHWVVTVTSEGIGHDHPNGSGLVPWSAIHHVVNTAHAVYLYVNPRDAYIVPFSAFHNGQEARTFFEYCVRSLGAAASTEVAAEGWSGSRWN